MIAADVTRQICIGLDYAHTLRGNDGEPLEIVHQDISPTNIMLSFTGTVKILDFGIARAAEFAEEEAKKGLIKGKVSYLSPEQIFVRPFDARADIFALGVVFHEMLTGRRLFQSRNDITKMRELLAAPILPPSAIDAMIPRELDRIVMESLEIDPKDRYQIVADMAADLERTLIAARYSSRDLSKLLRDLYQGRGRAAGGRRRGRRQGEPRTDHRDHVDHDAAADRAHEAVRHKEETPDPHGRRVARRALASAVDALARADQGDDRGAGDRGGRRRHRVRRQEVRADLLKRATSAPPPTPVMKNQDAGRAHRRRRRQRRRPRPRAGQEAHRAGEGEGTRVAVVGDRRRRPCPSGDATLPPTRAVSAAGASQGCPLRPLAGEGERAMLLEPVHRDRPLASAASASASFALSLSSTSSGARDV